jgi:hypothetical protein
LASPAAPGVGKSTLVDGLLDVNGTAGWGLG